MSVIDEARKNIEQLKVGLKNAQENNDASAIKFYEQALSEANSALKGVEALEPLFKLMFGE